MNSAGTRATSTSSAKRASLQGRGSIQARGGVGKAGTCSLESSRRTSLAHAGAKRRSTVTGSLSSLGIAVSQSASEPRPFDGVLDERLSALRSALSAEHQRRIAKLEARIASLSRENERLQADSSSSSPTSEPAEVAQRFSLNIVPPAAQNAEPPAAEWEADDLQRRLTCVAEERLSQVEPDEGFLARLDELAKQAAESGCTSRRNSGDEAEPLHDFSSEGGDDVEFHDASAPVFSLSSQVHTQSEPVELFSSAVRGALAEVPTAAPVAPTAPEEPMPMPMDTEHVTAPTAAPPALRSSLLKRSSSLLAPSGPPKPKLKTKRTFPAPQSPAGNVSPCRSDSSGDDLPIIRRSVTFDAVNPQPSQLMPGETDDSLAIRSPASAYSRSPRHSENSFTSRQSRAISVASDVSRMSAGVMAGKMSRRHTGEPTFSNATGRYEVVPMWELGRGGLARSPSVAARKPDHMQTFMDGQEDLDAKLDQSCFERCMIHPTALRRICWDLMGLLLIAYDCITVPMEFFHTPQTPFTGAMEWLLRVFWTLNLIVSTQTGYLRNDGVVEIRPAQVFRRYAMTWLPLDLFVVVFDWLEVGFSKDLEERLGGGGTDSWLRGLRGLRMIRTVRLLRMLKAPEITRVITEYIPFSESVGLLFTIGKIMVLFFWVAHIVACAWFLISDVIASNGRPAWVTATGTEHMTPGVQYAICLHWSLLTLAGNTSPVNLENMEERIFNMAILFIQFVVCAVYVGAITTAMTRLQIIVGEQSSKLAVLRGFLLDHNISRALAVRVQRNAQQAMAERKCKAPEEDIELLALISEPVMIEVHFEIYSKVLMNHPFFHCYNGVNPTGVRKVCHTAVSILSLHERDVLFSDLEVPETPRMYFVVSGNLQYLHNVDLHQFHMHSWLCEAVLWTPWVHQGLARAVSETRLLVLDAEKFQDIVSAFPTDHAGLYAEEFVRCLNQDSESNESKTDIGPSHDGICDIISTSFPLEEEEEVSESSSDEDMAEKGSRRRSALGEWVPTFFSHRGHAEHQRGSRRSSGSEGTPNATAAANFQLKRQLSYKRRANATRNSGDGLPTWALRKLRWWWYLTTHCCGHGGNVRGTPRKVKKSSMDSTTSLPEDERPRGSGALRPFGVMPLALE